MALAAEGDIPKALLDKPDMRPGLKLYYDGFWALSGDRPLTMGGIGQIPFASIDRYARRAGIDGRDEFDRFRMMIIRMDDAFVKHANTKPEEKGDDHNG
jgi:hypothetical protein